VRLSGVAPRAATDVPEADKTVLPDEPFVTSGCLAASRWKESSVKLHYRLGSHVLTDNPHWGRIWRADFTIDGEPDTRANRIVCWWYPAYQRWEIVFAIGQTIPPLTKGVQPTKK
jgi:hypothetical protein